MKSCLVMIYLICWILHAWKWAACHGACRGEIHELRMVMKRCFEAIWRGFCCVKHRQTNAKKKNWGRIHCRSVQNANTFPILSLQQPFGIQLENINCCAGRVALSYSPQAIDKVALHVSIAEYVTWLSTPKRCPSLHLVVRTTMPYLFFSLEKVINRTMKFHQVEFTRTLQRMDRKCDQDSEGYNMPLTCYNTLCPVGPWDYVVLNFWWLGFETRATTVPCLCVFLVLWALWMCLVPRAAFLP